MPMHVYRKKFGDAASAENAAKALLASYIDRAQPPQVGVEEEGGETWLSVVLVNEASDIEALLHAAGYARID